MIDVVYMAHPVGAPDAAGVAANVARATRWYRWLLDTEPGRAITAPWLATLLAGVPDDDANRARGLRDDCAIACRLDGIVLVGGRISTGMRHELDAVVAAGGWVSDCTWLGDEPPTIDAPLHPIDAGRFWWGR